MNSRLSIPIISLTISLFLSLSVHEVTAQKKYDTGASDTEIRIGNTMPYSVQHLPLRLSEKLRRLTLT
jgi:branched-chain amino acid transport system substrate-binding protein